MATAMHYVVVGSCEPIDVHLHDAKKHPDDPSGNVNSTGITSLDASAKMPGGTKKTIACTVIGSPLNGDFRLAPVVGTWDAVGTYDVQINWIDQAGNPRIYPSEGNQMKVKVSGAN